MSRNLPIKACCLFAEAWCLLGVARGMLMFLPFRKIVPFLGKVDDLRESEVPNALKLSFISLALLRASRYSPWRTKCLEQALAGKMMLMRRKKVSVIYFGVYRGLEKKLCAHAWLKCGGIIISGAAQNLEQYTVVSSFKS